MRRRSGQVAFAGVAVLTAVLMILVLTDVRSGRSPSTAEILGTFALPGTLLLWRVANREALPSPRSFCGGFAGWLPVSVVTRAEFRFSLAKGVLAGVLSFAAAVGGVAGGDLWGDLFAAACEAGEKFKEGAGKYDTRRATHLLRFIRNTSDGQGCGHYAELPKGLRARLEARPGGIARLVLERCPVLVLAAWKTKRQLEEEEGS